MRVGGGGVKGRGGQCVCVNWDLDLQADVKAHRPYGGCRMASLHICNTAYRPGMPYEMHPQAPQQPTGRGNLLTLTSSAPPAPNLRKGAPDLPSPPAGPALATSPAPCPGCPSTNPAGPNPVHKQPGTWRATTARA